ncbi:hypothetical protein HanOQP8_Chr03g0097601 [Helianthus annuus]|nr:hypothetical protein HanIR_Chr03g0111151 [Helianthus annuus]KAJ0773292.1 hypothetical protein HanOQP8_Chr03g0097601 [Helianthus annuus]
MTFVSTSVLCCSSDRLVYQFCISLVSSSIFSIRVSNRFRSVSSLCYVLLCFASADMTLLVLLISPLLSNFWLSRIFFLRFSSLFYR